MRRFVLAVAMATVLAWAGQARAQSILLFDENASYHHAMTALDDLALTYTRATAADFVTLLAGGTWDLVIVDLPSTEPTGAWTTELDTYIHAGGSVIATGWNPTSLALLASPFEYVYVGVHEAVALYRWDTTHPVFTSPGSVPDITAGLTDLWGWNGPLMRATGTGIELAGTTATWSDGNALIVLGNGGRTIMNGFLFDDYGTADNDGDTVNDCVELVTNEILLLMDPDADRDGDGYSIAEGDCNDWNDQVNPGVTTDMCDGLDNDCDPSTADGQSETWYGTPCDGTDPDSCPDGIEACLDGVQGCNDGPDGSPDICDGFDNDCDLTTPDGSGDARVGAPCDGPDADLCAEGTGQCVSGAFVCSDLTSDTPDSCDTTDDDCNPATADGTGEAWFGDPCDGSDTDLCENGQRGCVSGAGACVETGGTEFDEICDGIDNDCNPATIDGQDDARVGAPCDGDDPDLCAEGMGSCVAGSMSCSDTMGSTPELCDGIDNDCDPSTADGTGEAWFDGPCDGEDEDLCAEGVHGCVSGVETCSDATGDVRDLCNGLDDDCNPSTPDGAGEAWFDEPCDGPDEDLCAEGAHGCVTGVQGCDDFSGDNVEVCNGVDDDCDPLTREDTDGDGDGYAPCGGDCNDLDAGIHPGAQETCDGVDEDCDPMTDHDGDGDGFRDCEGDCAPMNPAVHPDAPVICTSSLDNDCNGIPDSSEAICAWVDPATGCGCTVAGAPRREGVLLALAAVLAVALIASRRRAAC